jgi:hypothetical protein
VPSNLAPHDWHHNGKVTQELFAEVEGQPVSTSSFSLFGGGRSGRSRSSASTNRGSATPGYLSPRSPASSGSPPGSPLALSPMLSAAASLSITRQEIPELPRVPSYEQSQLDNAQPMSPSNPAKADDWISGTKVISRNIMAIHNPSRLGGSSDLDERQSGFAPGIGVWDLKIFSDVVRHLSCRLRSELTCSSPLAVLFAPA